MQNDAIIVESVIPLNKIHLEAVKMSLSRQLSDLRLPIKNVINTTLIGGLKISYQGKVLDLSLKNNITQLQNHISQQQ